MGGDNKKKSRLMEPNHGRQGGPALSGGFDQERERPRTSLI